MNLRQDVSINYFKEAMNLPKVGDTISINIHGLGSSGEGVGYFNGFTVFVDGALPGETVEARLYQCQKRCGFAHLLSISSKSPDRVEPSCKFFGECGGCQLMHLSYEKQLEMKRQRVIDALKRIGKIEDCEVGLCVPSPTSLAYRNKIQLPVREKEKELQIGLYARASHDLVEIDHCQIHCALGEEIYESVASLIKQSGIKAYDPKTGLGELRHLLIKSAENTDEVLVILVTNQDASPIVLELAKKIMTLNPKIKGVVHNLQRSHNNVILGDAYKTLAGLNFIHERLLGLTFKVSPASFFQVNPKQAELLYSKALEFAELTGNETVLDAYCGVGTLSLIFAQNAKKVIGVECVKEAIQDARENAQINGVENASFVCASAESFITSLSDINLVLLNPPRKGCELSFLEGIRKLAPARLIYISCDPATLARDLSLLRSFRYKVDALQPYDMFPQTSHVESVVKLSLSI